MKISEYVLVLEKIKNEHGDLEVEFSSCDLSRQAIREPKIDYRAILNGREHRPRFSSYFMYSDNTIGREGEKVCRIV